MRVLFAPDWRDGVAYQRLLAEALAAEGVEVSFLRGYRRGFPLARLLGDRQHACDILHLHWPEAYYPLKHDLWDWFRSARFPSDLAVATRHCALATTAHNLVAHNRGAESLARHNSAVTFRRARVVFAHSEAARAQLVESFELDQQRIIVVPHGDLSVAMPPPISRASARAKLQLGSEKLCLMFGAVEPYKGIEEVFAHWKRAGVPAALLLAGQPVSSGYAAVIAQAAAGCVRISLRLERQSDEQLATLLSAADCVLFNYRAIFTSGAASLARSWGVPLLLPAQCPTVDLTEPNPRVFRFRSFVEDFGEQLSGALATPSDFASAAEWRNACRWHEVARLTAEGYRHALTQAHARF